MSSSMEKREEPPGSLRFRRTALIIYVVVFAMAIAGAAAWAGHDGHGEGIIRFLVEQRTHAEAWIVRHTRFPGGG